MTCLDDGRRRMRWDSWFRRIGFLHTLVSSLMFGGLRSFQITSEGGEVRRHCLGHCVSISLSRWCLTAYLIRYRASERSLHLQDSSYYEGLSPSFSLHLCLCRLSVRSRMRKPSSTSFQPRIQPKMPSSNAAASSSCSMSLRLADLLFETSFSRFVTMAWCSRCHPNTHPSSP